MKTTFRWIEILLKNSILKQVNGDVELASKLTPNYEIGCKRILLTNDFLPMFVQRPNVQLVTDEILEMTEKGIITKNGQTIDLDLIIFATGFHVEGQNSTERPTQFAYKSQLFVYIAWVK